MSSLEFSGIEIEATLPKPWEEQASFSDVLYDWMNRAPWFAISAAVHVLLFFVFQSIPWSAFHNPEEPVIQAAAQVPLEEEFDEPEEVLDEVLEEVPLEEPIPRDAEVAENEESEDREDYSDSFEDSDSMDSSPFNNDFLSSPIGLEGGSKGKFGPRGQGNENKRRGGGKGTERVLEEALAWLKSHQETNGSWDADGFESNCPVGLECGGPGSGAHDVGVTGLALLAFLGDGNTTNEGLYREVVTRGILWIIEQQDHDTGLIGDNDQHDFFYDHTIASLALCEAYYFSKSPALKRAAQASISTISRARDPYLAWRYDVPSNGDSDTSITGWAVMALTSAREADLTVDPTALEGALAWIDLATDKDSGRVGYDGPGTQSSRTHANAEFPREKGEAMTAVGLLSRFFLGQDPNEVPVMQQHADLILRTLPEWDPEGFGCDMYYWYYGSYAMFQMGGETYWKKWNKAMKPAVVDSQRQDAHTKGSWDPVGPWGYSGGRVYSTAMMALCLEVYFRYSRLLGAR